MRFRSVRQLSGILLLSWGAVWASPGSGEKFADVPENGNDLAAWIEALGSDVWSEREAAQRSLVNAGDAAIKALAAATSSTNLERAYRARHLLEALDPVIGRFALVKMRHTNGTPELVSIARTSGSANGQLVAQDIPVVEESSNTRRREFVIEFHPNDDSGLTLDVFEKRRGYSSTLRLMPPLANGISLVKISEESRYEQIGQKQERSRETFLTLMWTSHSRRSSLTPQEDLTNDEFLNALLAEVLGQAAGPDLVARRMAIEILSYWELPRAKPLFESARSDRELAAVAVLGLRQPESLRKLVRDPETTEVSGIPLASRAASLLIDSGDVSGIDVLFRYLLEGDSQYRHFYIASLTDAARHVTGTERDTFVNTALSEACMARLDWSDPESRLFFHRAIRALNTSSDSHRKVGHEALKLLDELASGRLGITSPNQRVYTFLWQSLFLQLNGEDAPVRDGWLELLARTTDPGIAISVFRELEPHLSIAPLTDSQLELLLAKATKAVETGRSPTTAGRRSTTTYSSNSSLQTIVRSLSGLQISEGQLKAVVHGLVRMGEAAISPTTGGSSLAVRKLAAELIRWTGRPNRREPVQTSIRSAKKWLNEADVEAREREVIAGQGATSLTQAMVLYEFDLRVRPRNAAPVDDSPHYTLLDGRRLKFTNSTWLRYSDRWGNRMLHAFEVEPPRHDPSRAGPKDLPPRFRIHGSTTTLESRVPTFLSIPQREKSVRWYETTNLSLGARYVSRPSTPRLETLFCLVTSEDDPIPYGAEASPEKLWDWFLKKHLLDTDLAEASTRRKGAVFHILRNLRIKAGVEVLRKLFTQAPYDAMSWQIARDLVALGDRTPLERYEADLKTLERTQRVEAAVLLTECGVAAGVDDLLTFTGENQRILRRSLYRAFRALEKFVAVESGDLERKKRIVDYVLANLSSSVSQSAGFQIIYSLSGDDFGFGSARGINNIRERREKIRLAIKAAQEWWKREREEFGQ